MSFDIIVATDQKNAESRLKNRVYAYDLGLYFIVISEGLVM